MDIIYIFLSVLFLAIVIILLQYISAFYLFSLLFLMAILLYIITYNKSMALTGLLIFIVVFFVIQYIYFNENIVLTVSPANASANIVPSTTDTTNSKNIPSGVPSKTVWYLSFRSD